MTRIRKQITATVDSELYKKMREISEKTQVPLARLLDNAMKMYIEYYSKKQED